MIRAITVTNYLHDSIRLELANPEKTGFEITSIKGLGPGKANINTKEISTTDGVYVSSARISSRNIVISLKYLWENSIEDVRQLSYKYFPIKKKVTLVIETDNRKAEIEGYVESNEPDIFSKDEGAEISIICPQYFFSAKGDDGENVSMFSSIEPSFEFPFSNESVSENQIEVGKIKNVAEKVIFYNGDAETGIDITIHSLGDAKMITIYNTKTGETMQIDTDKIASYTGSGIKRGDDISICTIKGKKSISLIREGKRINILNCLKKGAKWFQISKGDNVFAYTAEEGATNLQIKIVNGTLYEGV